MACVCRDCLITAHDFSTNNFGMRGLCGCFYCLQTFDASEIVEWIRCTTAVCPHCKIDSVLPGVTVDIGPVFLAAMRKMWFESFGGLNEDTDFVPLNR